jgi:tetratricopeptide (TPR) repeat protein
MGKSFSAATAESVGGAFDGAQPYYHPASDRYYSMFERGGEYFVRRRQLTPGGQETNVVEKRVDYVVGSGARSKTFLHRTGDDRLVELPVSWYSESGGHWSISPGYDKPDHLGFRRPVTYQCMGCHNAYPAIEPGGDVRGRRSRFPAILPQGIDCQRCHGPGRSHVDAAKAALPEQTIRAAIVNPATLPPQRQMEVCLRCHLETTSTDLPHETWRYDRGVFSYRPGEPLEDVTLHFDHAPGTGHDDKFQIVSSAYRLFKSKCFLESQGALTCSTCHDPHLPAADERAHQRYDGACRSCHEADLARLATGGSHNEANNCATCHMPERRTEDVVHATMTDHLIQRRPAGDLLGAIAEDNSPYRGPVVPYYPQAPAPTAENALYIALAQVIDGSNLDRGIPQLEEALKTTRTGIPDFYYELGQAYRKTAQPQKAIEQYRTAVGRDPDFFKAWQGLGEAYMDAGDNSAAVQAMRSALETLPFEAEILQTLGEAYLRLGQLEEAENSLERATKIDPDLAEARGNLGLVLIKQNRLPEAEAALRDAIRLRPGMAEARSNLATLLDHNNGDLAETRYQFEQAIRLRPDYLEARRNYAVALAKRGLYAEAKEQFESALRLDASAPDLHMDFGVMLAASGDGPAAEEQYRLALKANPASLAARMNLALLLESSARIEESIQVLREILALDERQDEARLRLGGQLLKQGARDEAIRHLQQAARSGDSAIREAAQSLLRLASARR